MSELTTGLERMFRAHHNDLQQRVDTLERAAAAIAAGTLGDALRATAERDAHKLASSLGTFGLVRGSELARELEHSLAAGRRRATGDVPRLSESVAALRAELDGARLQRDAEPEYSSGSERNADAHRELRRQTFESGLAGSDPAELTSGRILVVDDDPAVCCLLVAILRDAGYDARAVGSAREARYALEHETIALLLSDVSMPEETGLDLIRFALCEHPETATLLISALEDPGIAQVAIDFGAYGYLSKPVRRSAVLIGVMNALRRRDVEARERTARSSLEETLRLRTAALTEALVRLEGAAAQGRVLRAETIQRWAQSAECQDPGIGRHLKRVGHYCAVLGAKFGLHPESLELASMLHDVGKIAIPDRILLKAGTLTSEERLAMQTHTTIGHEMLRGSSSELLDLAALIAKTHHEKFDGSGYPCGLSGTNIPLEGRIAAVADAFDALVSDHGCREPWSAAVACIEAQRGTHFDGEIVDALVSSIDEIRSASEQ